MLMSMAGLFYTAPLLTSVQWSLSVFPFLTVLHLLVAMRAPTALKTHWQHHTWQAAGEETRRKRENILCRHSADTGADFKRKDTGTMSFHKHGYSTGKSDCSCTIELCLASSSP